MKKYVAILAAAAMLAMPLTSSAAFGSSNSTGSTGAPSIQMPSSSHGGGSSSSSSNKREDMSHVSQGSGASINSPSVALPPAAKGSATRINAGDPIYKAVGGDSGYLIGKKALTFVTVATQDINYINVPNLVAGLQVQVLYFDLKTKKWMVMNPTSVDYSIQTIIASLPAGTPYTIIY